MKKIILGFILFLVCSAASFAKVKLPDIIGDNMVLQQNTKVKLWGEATPNRKITITTSWNNLTYNGVSDAKGNWVVLVATPKASYQKHEIVINDGERICQMVIAAHSQVEWIEVEEINETERGTGGFGHTGKQ